MRVTLRTSVVVSVAAALLVSGAVSGSTLALWSDAEPLPAEQFRAGSIALTVDGQLSADLNGLSGMLSGLTPGTTRTAPTTLRNTGDVAIDIRVSGTVATNSDGRNLAGSLRMRVGTTATNCSAMPGNEASLQGYSTGTLLRLAPDQTATACVTVGLAAAAPAGVQGGTTQVAMTLTADQVRP